MMTETKIITIKHDTFTATVDLSGLWLLNLDQWRKLVRLATMRSWENEETIREAVAFLQETIADAQVLVEETAKAYVREYREPTLITGKREKGRARANNKKLSAEVRSAKRVKADWEKRLAAILEDRYYEEI